MRPAVARGSHRRARALGADPGETRGPASDRGGAVDGSSTLLVTMILLLLSGACLALLMATQTRMLTASQERVRLRLLAAAEGGVELAVARAMAGAVEPAPRSLGGAAPGAEILVEPSGLAPMARGPCALCMTNLEGTLGALGGLGRASHVVSATASAPPRADGLPPPRRAVSAMVDLAPWPAGGRDEWDLAATMAAARREVRRAASTETGGYEENSPLAVATFDGGDGGAAWTVAVGAAGSALYAAEVLPRPGPLWTFADASDEDGNGAPDLGSAVAPPAIARLRLGESARAVAVFGGGYDRERPSEVGNWLYMVDMGSGALLYKRELDAPSVATPAVADLTGDGVADVVYVGALAGSLYRVDASAAAPLAGGGVAPGAWTPRRVFDSGGLAVLQPPAVVSAPELGARVLAFGAGGAVVPPDSAADSPLGEPGEVPAGRFFVLVGRGSGRIGAADGVPAVDLSGDAPGRDRLAPELPPAEQGWSLDLAPGERVASPPLVVSGLLAFLTFRPTGAGGAGEVRRYSLQLRSGDPMAGGGPRSVIVAARAPWPSSGLGSLARIDLDRPGGFSAPLLAPDEERAVEVLRSSMPQRCRFVGARLRLRGEGPDGALLRLAVLPVCRVDADWHEGGMF